MDSILGMMILFIRGQEVIRKPLQSPDVLRHPFFFSCRPLPKGGGRYPGTVMHPKGCSVLKPQLQGLRFRVEDLG